MLALVATGVCTGTALAEPSATIRRTAHGIPHILASDYEGAGYGYGYAIAQDNICVLADTYVTVRAQRSRQEAFQLVWRLAEAALDAPIQDRAYFVTSQQLPARKPIPRLSEPWYC